VIRGYKMLKHAINKRTCQIETETIAASLTNINYLIFVTYFSTKTKVIYSDKTLLHRHSRILWHHTLSDFYCQPTSPQNSVILFVLTPLLRLCFAKITLIQLKQKTTAN